MLCTTASTMRDFTLGQLSMSIGLVELGYEADTCCTLVPYPTGRISKPYYWLLRSFAPTGNGQTAKWCWQGQKYLRSEEHTSELQSLTNIVCSLLLEKQ